MFQSLLSTLKTSYQRIVHACFFAVLILFSLASNSQVNELKLPDLGSAGGGLISPSQEFELGQRWLRLYRAQVKTSSDPFIQEYVEKLIRRLARYSDLEDKRLDILVAENPTLNAFAVPGGIVGVHTGLFSYAKTEEQFSSVLAHELGHLSQRHYARSLERQKDSSIPNMAALLASILVAATAGGDAGIAAIATTQAVAIDKQLRFSRQMEQEADRIGMATMINAKLDPHAMGEMFEQMLKSYRFRRQFPEFLLTHPLTESRVSDAKLRAQPYPKLPNKFQLEYQLLKTRVTILHENNTQYLVNTYANFLKDKKGNEQINRYALALSYLKLNEADKAEEVLLPLYKSDSNNLYYLSALTQIYAEQKRFKEAMTLIKKPLKKIPDNHPLNITLAEIYLQGGFYKEAETLLSKHSKRRPKDDYVWYLLAEVHGLTGDILNVHIARAEYFLLNGLYSKAEIQVRNGLELARKDERIRLNLEKKLKLIRKQQRETL